MPEFPIDPDLAAVSRALGGLVPKSPSLDRDRLLYEAGRRSVRSRPWPIVAGLFAILSTAFGVRLATMPPEVQIVYVDEATRERDMASRERERPVFASKDQTPGAYASGSPVVTSEPLRFASGYLGLRDQVVRFGVDSLPAASSGATGPRPSVEQLLGLPSGTLDDAQKSRLEHQLYRGGV